MQSSVVEVEVDSEKNADLIFHPIKERVRGSYSVGRDVKMDATAGALFNEWPLLIPGQRIGLDVASSIGYVSDPLHNVEHAPIAEKIKKRFPLPPARKEFPAHVPTWQYFLKAAVASGHARVVEGELPDVIVGQPNLDDGRQKDGNVRLAEAIDKQNEILAKQTEMFGKLLGELVANKRK